MPGADQKVIFPIWSVFTNQRQELPTSPIPTPIDLPSGPLDMNQAGV